MSEAFDAAALWSAIRAGDVGGEGEIGWPAPPHLRRDLRTERDRQRAEGFLAVPALPRLPLRPPVDWSADPFGDRSWLHRVAGLQPADVHLLLWRRRGDAEALAEGVALLLDWLGWHVRDGRDSAFAWSDMATGVRALKLALAVRGAAQGAVVLDDVSGELLARGIDAHLRALMDPAVQSQTNHGVFQAHGLRVLAGVARTHPLAGEARAFAAERMADLVDRQFNAEGFHLEHSADYHFFMARELGDLLRSGWWEDLGFSSLAARIEEAKNWLAAPDGRLVRVGDTLGFGPIRPPAAPPAPDVEGPACAVRLFPEGGWAVARAPAGQLSLQAAFHSRAHKHADDLHFDLWTPRGFVFVDAGAEGYNVSPRRDYVMSTRAHNTVEIDRADQPRRRLEAFGSALRAAAVHPWGAVFDAEVERPSLGQRHARRLLFAPGEWLMIEDHVTLPREGEITVWLHADPRFETARALDDGAVEFLAPDERVRVIPPPGARTTLHRAETEPRMQGWRAAGPNRLTPSWSAGFTVHARDTVLVTRVALASAPPDTPDESAPLWTWHR